MCSFDTSRNVRNEHSTDMESGWRERERERKIPQKRYTQPNIVHYVCDVNVSRLMQSTSENETTNIPAVSTHNIHYVEVKLSCEPAKCYDMVRMNLCWSVDTSRGLECANEHGSPANTYTSALGINILEHHTNNGQQANKLRSIWWMCVEHECRISPSIYFQSIILAILLGWQLTSPANLSVRVEYKRPLLRPLTSAGRPLLFIKWAQHEAFASRWKKWCRFTQFAAVSEGNVASMCGGNRATQRREKRAIHLNGNRFAININGQVNDTATWINS